jgi:hypothetical protein
VFRLSLQKHIYHGENTRVNQQHSSKVISTITDTLSPGAIVNTSVYPRRATKHIMQLSSKLSILPAILFSLTLVSAWPGFIDNLAGRHTTTESLEARDGAGGACEDGEFHCDGKTLHKCDHKGESWYDLHQVYLSCALASLMLSMGDGLRVRYELCCRRVRREPCVHLVYASCMFAAPLNSRGGKTSLIVPGGQERVW